MALALVLFLTIPINCVGEECSRRGGSQEAPGLQWHWALQNLQKVAERTLSLTWGLLAYVLLDCVSCLLISLCWSSKQASCWLCEGFSSSFTLQIGCLWTVGSKLCCFSRPLYSDWIPICVWALGHIKSSCVWCIL